MAGQYRFKDSNGNIVAQISASVGGAIAFSGSVVDFSQANNVILGNVQLAGTASNALLLDGFDSQAFAFTSSIHPFTASIAGTNTFTSSTNSRLNSIETISASNINRLNSLEEKTGSLATTGSNTFFGTQVFSGSVYVKENLIVQGSSSLQNITASAVDIGTNRIILNVDNPSVRYAGISVYDSGSTAGTGSLWWDSLNNHWLYEHPADSGAPYNSAILISGPKNAGNLGEELELVSNFVMKAVGGDHISASAIYDNGSTISLKSNTEISGTFKVGAYTSSFDGKVGIGTATPSTALTVVGNIKAGYESATGMIIGLAPNGIPTNDVNSYILWADAASFGGNNGDIIYIPRTSTDGMHRFYTGNGTPTEKLRITHTGLIGIGTNNPLYRLDILGPTGTTSSMRISATYNGGGLGMLHLTSDGDEGGGITYEKSSGTVQKWKLGCGNSGAFFLYNETGGTQPLTIGTNGNIGINTTSPAVKLQINGSLTLKSNSNQTIQLWNSGSVAADIGGNLEFRGTYRNSDNDSVVYSKIFGGKENSSDGNFAGYLAISTYEYPNSLSERVRINSSGNVGIGNTNPTFKLHTSLVGADIVSGNAISTSTMRGIRIDNTNNNNESVGVWFNTGGSHWSGITGQRRNYASGWGTDLRFYTHEDATNDLTYARERMRISSEGNIGIGTTNSAHKLWIQGNTTFSGYGFIRTYFNQHTTLNSQFDIFRFLNESGGLIAQSGISGILFVNAQDTNTGGNQISYTFHIQTNGNGTAQANITQMSYQLRGTQPIQSVGLQNDGSGGGVKVVASTVPSGVGGANVWVTFMGTAL
jgi:hypothetical protein